jgi:hypothetical protein
MTTKPVKVTLEIFGESVTATFTRTEEEYVAKISKTKAVKCYHAVISRLVENKLPEDTTINVHVNTCGYHSFIAMLMRFWIDDNGNTNTFVVTIEASYADGKIKASHNMFDWLQEQNKKVRRERLLLTDNRKIECAKQASLAIVSEL